MNELENIHEEVTHGRWPYHELVERSARLYSSHLTGLLADRSISPATHAAIETLLRTLDLALVKGSALTVEDLEFDSGTLDGVPDEELTVFINEWTLGLGAPDAPVVVMGTEHAYDDRDRDSLALESCASAVMWLSEPGANFVARICRDASYGDATYRPYHRFPIDYYQTPERKLRGNYTWKCVANAVGIDKMQLGGATYQIDRSAAPALYQASGCLPSPMRRSFLAECLRSLNKQAKVLILHGATRSWWWSEVNEELARAFLGTDDLSESTEERIGKTYLSWWRINDRTVILSRALNGPVTNAYMERIRQLVDLKRIAPHLAGLAH